MHGRLSAAEKTPQVRTGRPATFEDWLVVDRLEGRDTARSGRLRTRAIYDNLANGAVKAPYSLREKAETLAFHFSSGWPQKSWLILKALHELAKDGHPDAAASFNQVASKWLDNYMPDVAQRTWRKGVRLLRQADKKELLMPRVREKLEALDGRQSQS